MTDMRLKPAVTLALGTVLVFGAVFFVNRRGPVPGRSTATADRPPGAGDFKRIQEELRATEDEARRLEIRIAEMQRTIEQDVPPAAQGTLDRWNRFIDFEEATSRVQRTHARRAELENLDRQLGLTPDQRRAVSDLLERRDERLQALWGEASLDAETREEASTRRQVCDVLRPDQRPAFEKQQGDAWASWEASEFASRAETLGLTAEQREGLKKPLFEVEEEFDKVCHDLNTRMARGWISYRDYQEGLEKVIDKGLGRLRNQMTSEQLAKLRKYFSRYLP